LKKKPDFILFNLPVVLLAWSNVWTCFLYANNWTFTSSSCWFETTSFEYWFVLS